MAHLEAGNPALAAADAERVYRLANSVASEPFIISLLVRIGMLDYAHHVLWEGLRTRQWTNAQIEGFQRRLAGLDVWSQFLHGLAMERIVSKSSMDGLARERPKQIEAGHYYHVFGYKTLNFGWYMKLAPSGWFVANALDAVHYIDVMDQAIRDGAYINSLPAPENVEGQTQETYYRIPMAANHPTYNRASIRAMRQQIHIRLAETACALERYFIENQDYPESLSSLTPKYLSSVPVDLADGQELRYRRTDDGRFCLYSIGQDQRDNDGRTHAKSGGRKGDWVWAYEPQRRKRDRSRANK